MVGLCALESTSHLHKGGASQQVQEAAAPKLMDTPASLQSRPKLELQTSLPRPLLRETEAWEAGHRGLWSQKFQVGALDLLSERSSGQSGWVPAVKL